MFDRIGICETIRNHAKYYGDNSNIVSILFAVAAQMKVETNEEFQIVYCSMQELLKFVPDFRDEEKCADECETMIGQIQSFDWN